ncbi:hypothetical protein ACVWY0_004212 [Arthrobacter sp. UYNi723]
MFRLRSAVRHALVKIDPFRNRRHTLRVHGEHRHMIAVVHYHHTKGDKVFDQDGLEIMTLDDDGRIKTFSAFIRDSHAFDEFFG